MVWGYNIIALRRNTKLKACVCYFLSIFYFSLNYSPSQTEKCFLFHLKSPFRSQDILIFVFLPSPLFVPVSHCFRGWSKINSEVYDITNCLNKNLTHFVWYFGKEKRYDIETWSIDRVFNKKYFYGKIMQKMCTKS